MDKITGLILIGLLGFNLQLLAQEICDNAIDDDADGLIDFNDDDCFCNTLVPSSLIPNPSFEEMFCCPTENEQLNCALGWIQASPATTDYVHTCDGYLGNTSIPAFAPLPFPDGEGGVGFRDGQAMAGDNYKEYVGACLNQTMEAGVTYRLDFFVGFRDNVPGNTEFRIALFATNECFNLPFGGNDFMIGCPLNAGNYVQLGEMEVSGSNEWVNVVFEFVADQAYEVIVLGPSCSPNPNFLLNPYFYVDRLTLAESSAFGVPFESITGSICENDLVLMVEDSDANSYQWYKDGVAIPGEVNASLSLTSIDNTEGAYMVVITTPEGCLLSQEYNLLIPPYYASQTVNLCEGEEFIFGPDTLTEAGFYERWLAAADGCDSVIQLTLSVNSESYFILQDTFCLGDTYSFYDISTTEAGTFQTIIPNTAGCDSIITLELSLSNQPGGLELVDLLEISLGEQVDLRPVFIDPAYSSLVWTDESGNTLGNEYSIDNYQPFQNTTIYLEAFNSFQCSVLDSTLITVLPNHILYVPNAFSPDGNGINDHFRFYPPISLGQVQSFLIFDRWGGLAFEERNIIDLSGYLGWDGTIDGKKATPGVYTYLIQALFLDGTEKIFAGDLTLLR